MVGYPLFSAVSAVPKANDAEDGGIRSNSQRECENRRQRKTQRAPQQAEAVLQIVEQFADAHAGDTPDAANGYEILNVLNLGTGLA